jgi:hypothetical protein
MGGTQDRVRELARDLRRLADAAAQQETRTGRLNVTGRVNRAVNVNIAGGGSSEATSSRQKVRIRQTPDGTVEHVETVTRTFRPDRSSASAGEPGDSQDRRT